MGQRKVPDNFNINWEKQKDTSKSLDLIKLKLIAENQIDGSKALKDQITFNKNEHELKGDNLSKKESKTN